MEERRRVRNEDGEIDLSGYIAIFQKIWWKVMVLSLAAGIVTLLVMYRFPNTYRADALISPVVDEKKPSLAIGALTSIGLDLGGPSKAEDLELLFNSKDLTVRVFRKYNLWPVVFPDKFDPATGIMKISWTDRLLGREKGPRPPGDWDAIRAMRKSLNVSVNKKAGAVSISFESPSAEGSVNILKYYLEEGKSRLQEEAFERAAKNKKFIEEQIGRTIDPLVRDRLYSSYGQEVEREMMARNREQFGFKVIDSARVPDRKTRPQRLLTSLLAATFFFLSLSIISCVWIHARASASIPSENSRR
jgi:uncharacterized protein involved in exopolysaccharide biosynthesis